MAKDDSILLRSAESIGRVIGTLQRQLEGARGRLSELVVDGDGTHDRRNGSQPHANPRQSAGRTAARNGGSTGRKTKTDAGAAKSKRAAKSTAARSGAKRRKM